MSCKPACLKTTSLDGPGGRRIMVAVQGNKKFPAGTPHIQCSQCAAEEYKQIMAQIAKLEAEKSLGPGLAAEYQRVQNKVKSVLEGAKE